MTLEVILIFVKKLAKLSIQIKASIFKSIKTKHIYYTNKKKIKNGIGFCMVKKINIVLLLSI